MTSYESEHAEEQRRSQPAQQPPPELSGTERLA